MLETTYKYKNKMSKSIVIINETIYFESKLIIYIVLYTLHIHYRREQQGL